MKLGVQVGLDPGHIALDGTKVNVGSGDVVLDGVAAPAKGAQQSPFFRNISIVATVAHLSYC